MPGYIQKSLIRLQYKPSVSPQFSPHKHTPFTIGKKGTQQVKSDVMPLDTKKYRCAPTCMRAHGSARVSEHMKNSEPYGKYE